MQALGGGGRAVWTEARGSPKAVKLGGPQATVHDLKCWEAQGWGWHLQVLARMRSASATPRLF